MDNNIVCLAAEINTEHAAAQSAMQAAVSHAIRAGELLLEAKGKIPHGEFGGWCASLPFSETTARGYMRLARLDPAKRQRVAEMPLREALESIVGPRKARSTAATKGLLAPIYGLPTLDGTSEFSASLEDNRLIVISPSEGHAGYFFVDCVNTRDWIAEGWDRPVKQEYVPACLNILRIPPDTDWMRHDIAAGRSIARWIKPEPIERAAKCIALGIMPS